MANLNSPMSLTSGAITVRDSAIGATADGNVFPGACTFYEVSIDNSANASQKEYLKFYNAAAPTVGTTVPDMIIPVAGGATTTMMVPEGIAFGTGFSVACVTAGGTGGTVSPTSSVVMTVGLAT